eukprot:TRINITY_DN18671_c0_g1_i1.p1 TRINITY_DN18671_c0_g1~~TRINITY_DN18671_c0_g1_i1.p1  ORF type:complete len:134 (+),score=0.18 TRINITY_DN18671_c0_g1_i1:102-503(+)
MEHKSLQVRLLLDRLRTRPVGYCLTENDLKELGEAFTVVSGMTDPVLHLHEDSLFLRKGLRDDIECTWEGVTLRSVAPNGPGWAAGAERFIGRKLIQINDQAVPPTSTIGGATFDGLIAALLTFEPLSTAVST